ncbi:hypothetical protein Pelo_17226 [Pelomyxa schiedti]|nr:hypothetical protein Pelo_17226 [Pelomyxa schiedti]
MSAEEARVYLQNSWAQIRAKSLQIKDSALDAQKKNTSADEAARVKQLAQEIAQKADDILASELSFSTTPLTLTTVPSATPLLPSTSTSSVSCTGLTPVPQMHHTAASYSHSPPTHIPHHHTSSASLGSVMVSNQVMGIGTSHNTSNSSPSQSFPARTSSPSLLSSPLTVSRLPKPHLSIPLPSPTQSVSSTNVNTQTNGTPSSVSHTSHHLRESGRGPPVITITAKPPSDTDTSPLTLLPNTTTSNSGTKLTGSDT